MRWTWCVVVCLTSVFLSGCSSDIWQPNNYTEDPVVADNGCEDVRIFVPHTYQRGHSQEIETLVPIRIERVAHADDEPGFDSKRVRCLAFVVLGKGMIVTGLEPHSSCSSDAGPGDAGPNEDGYCEVRQIERDVDRGGSISTVIRAHEPGTSVLRARLFDQRCEQLESAVLIAFDEIFISFFSTGVSSPSETVDADISTETDADDDFSQW